MRDPHTRESRGFGFVNMATGEQADAAKSGLQGEVYEGRTLSIEKARRSRPRTPTPGKYFGPPKRSKSSHLCVPSLPTDRPQPTIAVLLAASEVVTATMTDADSAAVTTMEADLEAVMAVTDMATTDTVDVEVTTTATTTEAVTRAAAMIMEDLAVPTVMTVTADAAVLPEAMMTDAEVTEDTTVVPAPMQLPAMLTPQLLLPTLLLLAAVVLMVRSAVLTDTNAVRSTTNDQGDFHKSTHFDMTASSNTHSALRLLSPTIMYHFTFSRHLLAALPHSSRFVRGASAV